MIQKISEPVSVGLVFDCKNMLVCPRWVLWNGRRYPIVKLGLHHTFREGRTLFHVFSAAGETLFFRLVLNSETLHWKLEEISDGLPS
jgi:hypothetical protein